MKLTKSALSKVAAAFAAYLCCWADSLRPIGPPRQLSEVDMKAPPKRLENAVVLHYVVLAARHRPTRVVDHMADGKELPPAAALAICRHAGVGEVDLCHCTEDWGVLREQECNSEIVAFRSAAEQFEGLTEADWTPMPDSTAELERALHQEKQAINALPDDHASDNVLRHLLREGRDIEAIARLRTVKDLSLFDAMQYIRSLKS